MTEFPTTEPTMQGRRSNIGPYGVASLAVSLVAAIISLCGIGGMATLAGAVAMLTGFSCFYLNRETGSKRDLLIGIGGMLLGFMIFTSSIYFDRTALLGMEGAQQEENEQEDAPEEPAEFRPPPEDPFATPNTLPEPTRPATRKKADGQGTP